MKYTKSDLVIGTIIKISSEFTITRITETSILFGEETAEWKFGDVLNRVNNGNWKIIFIPKSENYEIY